MKLAVVTGLIQNRFFIGTIAGLFVLFGFVGCSQFSSNQPANPDPLSVSTNTASTPSVPAESTPIPTSIQISLDAQGGADTLIDTSPTPVPSGAQTTQAPEPEPSDSRPSISAFLSAELSPQTLFQSDKGEVTAMAISPDSARVAFGLADGSLYLMPMDGSSSPLELAGHSARIRDLAFSPDGSSLASAGEDSQVEIWDTQDGSLTQDINTSFVGRALSVAYSPDGAQIAIGGHKCFVAIYSAWSGILNRTLVQPNCSPKKEGSVEYWEIVYSADGTEIYTADGQPAGSGGAIYAWPLESFSQPEIIKGLGLGIRTMAISPDEELLALSLIGSPQILLINTDDGRINNTLEGHLHRVNSLDFSPDGELLASASTDGTIRLWDTSSGLLIQTLEGHTAAVNQVSFSPDGSVIASGSDDGRVVLWSFTSLD